MMTWGEPTHDDDQPQPSRTGWIVLAVIYAILAGIALCAVSATNTWWPV